MSKEDFLSSAIKYGLTAVTLGIIANFLINIFPLRLFVKIGNNTQIVEVNPTANIAGASTLFFNQIIYMVYIGTFIYLFGFIALWYAESRGRKARNTLLARQLALSSKGQGQTAPQPTDFTPVYQRLDQLTSIVNAQGKTVATLIEQISSMSLSDSTQTVQSAVTQGQGTPAYCPFSTPPPPQPAPSLQPQQATQTSTQQTVTQPTAPAPEQVNLATLLKDELKSGKLRLTTSITYNLKQEKIELDGMTGDATATMTITSTEEKPSTQTTAPQAQPQTIPVQQSQPFIQPTLSEHIKVIPPVTPQNIDRLTSEASTIIAQAKGLLGQAQGGQPFKISKPTAKQKRSKLDGLINALGGGKGSGNGEGEEPS